MGSLRLVKSTCSNLGIEVVIASKSGWIVESTPKASSSSQFSLIKKILRTGAPPLLYNNANDAAASDDTTQHAWGNHVCPYLILDEQPCTVAGWALCRRVPRVRRGELSRPGVPAGRRHRYLEKRGGACIEQG